MVEHQILDRGIWDKRVIEAMRKIPRHLFVPQEYINRAYDDEPLPIGEGQTISQPYIVALMTETLELKGEEIVLEIGTGSGYQTAILCALVKKVYTVEYRASLARNADKILNKLGFNNYEIIIGDGSLGCEEHSPFDAIIVTAGAPSIPQNLLKQLKIGGRLVIPVGPLFSQKLLKIIKKSEKEFREIDLGGCAFVKLVGKNGWSE